MVYKINYDKVYSAMFREAACGHALLFQNTIIFYSNYFLIVKRLNVKVIERYWSIANESDVKQTELISIKNIHTTC